MTLDAEVASLLAQLPAGPSIRETGVEPVRAEQRLRRVPELPAVHLVRDLAVPGATGRLRARLYQPGSQPAPLVVYLHGGGWSVCSIDTHDAVCRRLALASDAAVLAVDYRLAPEHPWPAPLDDVVQVVRWATHEATALGASPLPVAVAGDSAGGNLATCAALRLRDDGDAVPSAQLLLYPNTDLTACFDPGFGDGPGLSADDVRFFVEQYVPGPRTREHQHVSPLLSRDLSGLPPAVVVTAGLDPLRPEGDAYAAKLAQHGVEVSHLTYDTLPHGYVGWPTAGAVAHALSETFAAFAMLLPREGTLD